MHLDKLKTGQLKTLKQYKRNENLAHYTPNPRFTSQLLRMILCRDNKRQNPSSCLKEM